MAEALKLCPLSFGFNIRRQSPSLIDTKRVDINIQIGFSCLKEKCLAYEEDKKWCSVLSKEIP